MRTLWPVLEAQEHRDTQALCALLQDTKATVRDGGGLGLCLCSGQRLSPLLAESTSR